VREAGPDARRRAAAERLVEADDDVAAAVLGELDGLDDHRGVVHDQQRRHVVRPARRPHRKVEPVALRHREVARSR